MVASASGIGSKRSQRRSKSEIKRGQSRPVPVPVNQDAIPLVLRQRAQWVAWKWERRENTRTGKAEWTKPPIDVHTGKHASSTNPSTWTTFQHAFDYYRQHRPDIDGPGFVFTSEAGIVGVDLDECRDPETGTIDDWANEIIARFRSYTEVSPTQTGVKIFVRGTLPEGERNRCGNIELYSRARFFTVTGNQLPGTPPTVEERQAELEELQRSLKQDTRSKGKTSQRAGNQASMSDLELVEKAKNASDGAKFSRLWSGDISGYPSHSEADQALCNLLAFWTGRDAARIDALFRQSGLFRDKWEREDYRRKTIEKTLAGRTEFYSPNGQAHNSGATASTGGTPPPPNDTGHAGSEDAGSRPSTPEAEDDPHRLARLILEEHRKPDGLGLRYWREEFRFWNGTVYRTLPAKELRAQACQRIKEEFDRLAAQAARHRKQGQSVKDNGKKTPPVARKVTAQLLTNTLQALAGMTLLPSTVEPPTWLEGQDPFTAGELLTCNNGLIHLPSFVSAQDYSHALTPRFFSPNGLGYDFNPNAGQPVEWLRFLKRVWPADRDADTSAALQEWFGYCLLPDTRQHKILMIVGPKRSGKGTIARVLRALIGIDNTTAPTLAGLGSNFGLWPLLGKTLAIISDARLSGRSDAAIVVERLLSISGEDAQTIDRKCMSHVTTKLPVRFVILTNELPRLSDASGAIVSRIIVLRQTLSWYGQEDIHLTDRLLRELPSILLWAIDGWKRLQERGCFVQPMSGQMLIADLEDLASPVSAFIRERCTLQEGAEIFVRDLFAAWKSWCEEKGRKGPGTEQSFGRDLRAALPALNMRQPRLGDGRVRVYEGIRLRELGDEEGEN
jgi:putative DNA primase/helicase